MHQMQPDVTPEYGMHKTHRTQSSEYEGEDSRPLHLTQDSILWMNHENNLDQ